MDISQTVNLLYRYSYLILFPLVVIEGPIVTLISGFLVSVKFMAFVPTYIVIVLGDLAGDLLYYFAGKMSFRKLTNRIINKPIVNKYKQKLLKRSKEILFFAKLSHFIGGPILFLAGKLGVDIKEFIIFNFLATLPKSLIIILVGYYFGSATTNFRGYLDLSFVGLVLVTFLLVIIYYIISKTSLLYIKGKK